MKWAETIWPEMNEVDDWESSELCMEQKIVLSFPLSRPDTGNNKAIINRILYLRITSTWLPASVTSLRLVFN